MGLYQEFLDSIDRKAYHEGEWQWEEDGMTVTRTYHYSPPGCHDSCGVLIYTKDDGASYLILNTGEFASVGDNFFHAVSEGLICLGNAEHKYALIDSFTGEKLYDFVYDTINPVDSIKPDYIYCEDGDEIIIYKVNIVPEY